MRPLLIPTLLSAPQPDRNIRLTCPFLSVQLLNEEITQEHGLVDSVNKKKRASRLEKLSEFVTEHDRVLPLLRQTLQRASQLSVRFYRWLRSAVHDPGPWDQSVARLKALYDLF